MHSEHTRLKSNLSPQFTPESTICLQEHCEIRQDAFKSTGNKNVHKTKVYNWCEACKIFQNTHPATLLHLDVLDWKKIYHTHRPKYPDFS